MLIIYGSDLCPDCIQCKAELDKAGIAYEYRSVTEKLSYMKEFLSLRDKESVFNPVRESGKIGIPCILQSDGAVFLTWEQYLL